MKSSTKLISAKILQIGSFGLILLFLLISTAQLFHIHAEVHLNEKAVDGGKKQQFLNKCPVCDYYHHVYNQQMLLSYPIALTSIHADAITLNTQVLTRAYAVISPILTNRGPPGFS